MIKAIITDFDGTLVDTFEANLRAYQEAFYQVGITLMAEKYRECFGYRFDRFMQAMAVTDETVANQINDLKKEAYPKHFSHLIPNTKLIELIATFHQMGAKTAIASTARKENLMNAVNYLGIAHHFDLIYAGGDVKQGKPSPEIYLKTMETLEVKPEEVLIFEDSPVGFQAAKDSGAKYIPVTSDWFTE
jgi:beta-phosphoglucomutase